MSPLLDPHHWGDGSASRDRLSTREPDRRACLGPSISAARIGDTGGTVGFEPAVATTLTTGAGYSARPTGAPSTIWSRYSESP